MNRAVSKLVASVPRRVTLVVCQNADRRPFYTLSPDVDYLPLGSRKRPASGVGRMAYYVYLLGVLRRAARRKGCRVVLSFMDAVNVHTVLAMIGTGIPVVVSERNDPAMHDCGRAVGLLRQCLYPRAKAIVVQTGSAADYFP